jgi:hypothetical protein
MRGKRRRQQHRKMAAIRLRHPAMDMPVQSIHFMKNPAELHRAAVAATIKIALLLVVMACGYLPRKLKEGKFWRIIAAKSMDERAPGIE